jgi:hypothetical protein
MSYSVRLAARPQYHPVVVLPANSVVNPARTGSGSSRSGNQHGSNCSAAVIAPTATTERKKDTQENAR